MSQPDPADRPARAPTSANPPSPISPSDPLPQDLAERVEFILGPSGPIARHLGASGSYESRPEQVEMARQVAQTFSAYDAANRSDRRVTRLLAEAGTGVGKSFAYLVPAILRCLLHNEKVVIATATISLQEQLMSKDIPLLVETLASWGLPAEVGPLLPVLAKGRGNYVSIRRLKLASQRQDALMPDAEQRHSLHVIEDWAYETRDGSLSSLPALERADVWEHVRSDSDNCMGRKCPHYQDCFYQNARRAIEQANLIICNHALFFADLSLRAQGIGGSVFSGGGGGGGGGGVAGMGAILPNYHHVVFDEAHNLEDAAASYFGLNVSEPRVRRLLRTLYSPRRRKGYLAERSLSIADVESVDRAIALVIRAEDASRRFFDQLLQRARAGTGGDGGGPGFGSVAGGGGGGGGGGGAVRLRRSDADDIDNTLTPIMRDLAVRLRLLRENVKAEADRYELSSLARRAQDIGDTCEVLLAQSLGVPKGDDGDEHTGYDEHGAGVRHEPRFVSDEDEALAAMHADDESEETVRERLSPYVYWIDVERDPQGSSGAAGAATRFGPRVTLSCAPVDVAPILSRTLFDPDASLSNMGIDEGGDLEALVSERTHADGGPKPAPKEALKPRFRPTIVLTSATLATRTPKSGEHPERAETAFGHVMSQLGLPSPPHTQTLQLGSPFDYANQVEVFVDLSMPNPRADEGARGQRSSAGSGLGTYARALAERIEHHVRATDGGAFVLFTSFVTLNAVATVLRVPLGRAGLPLICQGADGSRAAVLSKFLESDRSVLFGAASFWQGVDVRGERLRNVIITRLPFEPPDRPITQARLERLEALGQNPFAQDSLPRAIIRFKQGFGRLIRSKSDRGRVVVLDPRVVTTGYGRQFLAALPPGVRVQRIEPERDEFERESAVEPF